MDHELLGTIFFFGNSYCMENVRVDLSLSSDWSVSHIDFGRRICSSFDGCSIPFYEGIFSRLNFWLPFNEFEEGILRHTPSSPRFC